MATAEILPSPTIFDKMLGLAHTPGVPRGAPQKPTPLKDDTTHRFYLCKKEEGAKWTYKCQRGSLEQVCAEATAQRRALPGTPVYTGIHTMDVAAGCPAWNDQLVLAHKLRRPVSLGSPLAAPVAPAVKNQ